jgi:nickel/cobalt transporter (NicO) family protein
MNRKFRRYSILSFLTGLTALFWFTATAPSQAHWADLSAAEIWVDQAATQITLTVPTGLMSFADDDRSGQLSPAEVRHHTVALQDFLNQQIQLTDHENRSGTLTVKPLEEGTLPPTMQVAPNSHSTLLLNYVWTQPIRGLKIRYNLFLPDVSTATCLATIEQAGHLKTFVFSPKQQHLALTPGLTSSGVGGLLMAIAGAFVWGAVHSMSPGHGKTIVGAYLVGERATPKHALVLACVTTITHTIGVFTLGLITLFAAQYILPEQLYPWLSLISGVMVVAIGFNLLKHRLRNHPLLVKLMSGHQRHRAYEVAGVHLYQLQNHLQNHSHPVSDIHCHADGSIHNHAHHSETAINHSHHHTDHHHGHGNSHSHSHSGHAHSHKYDHQHNHKHSQHGHSHLPPGADGSPVTWRNLLALGVSGGLVPCPAALVLLLSTIALGNVSLGLLLVLAFSLGLAGVLTGLGLLLVYAKRIFQQVPSQLRIVRVFPVISAAGILLVGCGISTKAIVDLGWLPM